MWGRCEGNGEKGALVRTTRAGTTMLFSIQERVKMRETRARPIGA